MSLIYSNAFNTDFGTVRALQTNGIVTDGVANPNGIPGHLQIFNNQYTATMYATDVDTVGGNRSEIIPAPNMTLGLEYWIAWECLVNASEWNANATSNVSIAQIHPLDSLVVALNFLLVLKYGLLYMAVPALDPPIVGTNSTLTLLKDFTYGQWHKFVIHWKPINDDTGYFELSIDGVAYYRNFNHGTAYNLDTPYFKLGLYDSNHDIDYGASCAAHYRNLNIYLGSQTYASVLGQPPVSPQLLLS